MKKFMIYLIKLSSSSSEISGAVFIPEESKDEDFLKKKNSLNLMI